MPKIIVSYRRSDSAAITGRIFDRLTSRYGDESVFMDIDNIPFGIDFRTHIKGELEKSDIVVAVIGPRWLGAVADGPARINEAADPVRVEVETALRSGVTLIPVLVDGATMPTESELPEGLKPLAFINAAPVDTGRDFRAHMDRLIRSMDGILVARGKPTTAPPSPAPVPTEVKTAPLPAAAAPAASRSRMVWLAIPLVLIAVAAGVWAFMTRSETNVVSAPKTPGDPTSVQYPAYKGRVGDEIGFLHADTVAALTQKLADLETKSAVQVVIALLRDVPSAPPVEFAEELSRRWKVGGDKKSGVLLIMYPNQRRLTLLVGSGAQDRLDRGISNLITQEVDKRLQSGDVVGGLMHGVDDLIEVLTGDVKAWQARVTGTSSAPTPVAPPAPPPTTYRILPNVSGGVQNLRTGPATKYPVVFAIPAGSTGITISGCQKSEDGSRPWCAANWRTYSGWISSCCIVDEKTGAPPRLD